MAFTSVECEIYPDSDACFQLIHVESEGGKMMQAQFTFLGAALALAGVSGA